MVWSKFANQHLRPPPENFKNSENRRLSATLQMKSAAASPEADKKRRVEVFLNDEVLCVLYNF